MTRFRFHAEERLKRRQQIDTLFRKGKAFSVYPLRIVFLAVPRPPGERARVKVGFSIPKKRIRSAVKRNRIRRCLRESWRLQKHRLHPLVSDDQQWWVFLIYQDHQIPQGMEWSTLVAQIMEKLIRFSGDAAPESKYPHS